MNAMHAAEATRCSAGLTRRELLQRAGGGIVVLLAASPLPAPAQYGSRLYPEDFNAYLTVRTDGRVTVFSGKIEMGQGVLTSQAQMVAEELGVELAAIDMVLGDTDRCPWDMGTFGSLTTRMFGPALRAAAAQARLTLLSLAAKRWSVDVDRLEARDGVVSMPGGDGRRVSYGELSQGARITHVIDQKAQLKAARDFHVMGRSPARLDALDKVTGRAQYAADIRLPGMLHARLLRPPVHGASLQSVDTREAASLPGVRVVRDKELVAVLHADPEAADRALATVRAQWHLPPGGPDGESIFDHLVRSFSEHKTTIDRGDVQASRASAARRFTRTYRKGYVAHAPIETHAALAEPRDGRLTVWASTQTPFPTRDSVARALGLDAAKVRVVTPYVGGGFGGKSASAQAVEAARLAWLAGVPVQVARTRSEEFFYDTFDPAAVVRIESSLDASGRMVHWESRVVGAGERGSALFYDVPNARVQIAGASGYAEDATVRSPHPFAVGPWRAPGANMNVFAIESQIDDMAAAARIDPLAFRLRHLKDARMRRTLEAAATAFGWQGGVGPSGRGVGMALSIDAGTCVAAFAQVSLDRRSGKVSVKRIVCAQDMGVVVNPEGAKMQIEGGLAMGLGYALGEELRFRGGDILDRNFDTYRLPRFADVPVIEALLVPDDELAPQGGGEPSITCTGAVIANALFDLTGVRMERLPMSGERVLAALKAG